MLVWLTRLLLLDLNGRFGGRRLRNVSITIIENADQSAFQFLDSKWFGQDHGDVGSFVKKSDFPTAKATHQNDRDFNFKLLQF